MIHTNLEQLSISIEGELKYDDLHRNIYATDASVYRKLPMGVVYPKNESDLKKIIHFANQHQITIVPRTAGTSLAGQCVTDGLVVDVSKHLTNIIEFNPEKKQITVQPGVIRDELNRLVRPSGLFFGPNTSTANRCMIGGMVGNNSSGTTSIRYGVTRDKIISLKTLLSDGSEAIFSTVTQEQFLEKATLHSLEGKIYRHLIEDFTSEINQQEINNRYPNKDIHRRNTGYAIDDLLKFEMFGGTEKTINLARLLSGSEGTLAITTEVTLQLDDLPPSQNIMIGVHYHSIQECMESVVVAMKHKLYNCELMDKIILDCTKNNRSQQKNRFFLEGDPRAILMIEVASDTLEDAEKQAEALIDELKVNNFGYAYPKIYADKIANVHELRAAGLGALGNIIGDRKAVACIEDTAVSLPDLPSFIAEFTAMMDKYGQDAVYYAHAGAGEIHLRPILNLKIADDVTLFRTITTEVAKMVKRYNGSLSGEHGDGIVRSEFIPMMIGEHNYQLLVRLKEVFDPNYIFNKGKIIDPYKMDESLRYVKDREEPVIETIMNFDDNEGVLKFAEKCNGSGDCRKSVDAGGVMCPSYRATKNEKDTTRARANALREILTNNKAKNKFNDPALKEAFDLCISCKACASECPSNVDIATLKAEFLYQYQQENGYALRSKMFANITKINKKVSIISGLVNMMGNTYLAKKALRVAVQRNLPKLHHYTLKEWYDLHEASLQLENPIKTLYFFNDEFTNFYDVLIGIDAVKLLYSLNYQVKMVDHEESGRSLISKGFLKEAKQVANKNIQIFSKIINKDVVLVGIEPSAILSFRDEYLRFAKDISNAKELSKHVYTIEEFISNEILLGNITQNRFNQDSKEVKIHVHCHQKSLSNVKHTFDMINIIPNYKVTIINSGCCGMAGSFGYEEEHYDMSMQIGEDSLFPKIRNAHEETIIVAAGTSCRHQIKDGTQKVSHHPVSVLKNALA